ncbi:ribonuclease T [Sphingomonas sp. RHCKR47]|uniref:ribonuclease T2 family protein n=1 Tax=Sphingomonas citricola TaxID=2862498 RepID=UPI001CA4EE7C|nr:ribonuclease T [Sphingomonas citricola]MBW6522466.1 ribonuclease T [Sphingomonas citricola]
MNRAVIFLLGAAAVTTPAVATAQANACRIPSTIERPHPDLPSASQPVRRLPIGSYTLAISWSPEYCRSRSVDRGGRSDLQCGGGNDFGFVLHGLWPDGVGKDWPQYCQATPILPTALIRQHLCATPSPQLMQHEWSKHGTCMPGTSPQAYFARSNAMFARLRFPDMDGLSRRPLTVAEFQRRFAAVNRLPANAVRVTTKKAGWLDELWLCTDKRFRYTPCDAEQGGGAPAGQQLRIWRGHR